ncbi:MAG: exodeoxyribonuclease beta subunit [Verrucomicrobiota bacterium]|jgi:exodeoxyribonuclease V beta subunit
MTPFDVVTVSLEPGVTLIEASAGTGKTYSITGLILRLILEKHLPLRDILAVTFTEAATQELRDRVRRRLQAALIDLSRGESEDPIIAAFLVKGDVAVGLRELDLALQSFDEAQIFTIHGFCQRMLNDYAFESGARFDTTLVTDPKPLFQEVARDFWRLRFYGAQPLLPTLAMAWNRSPDDWVKLLEQTRSHPDLVILPPPESKTCDELLGDVERAFTAVKEEWKSHHTEIERLLRDHGGLSRAEKNFSPSRVTELIATVDDACGQFEFGAPESIGVFSEICSEAIAEGTKASGTAPVHRFFELSTDFCQAVAALFNQLTHEFLDFASEELPKRKALTNTVTYDDLITGLRDALRQEGGKALARAIGEKHRTALIDEFQDTDPAQAEIFRTIFTPEEHRLFLIGDPKQAIYGFRGADVFTYFDAARGADRKFTLVTNWRSEASLLSAINGLFTQARRPFIFEEIQYHEVAAPKRPLVTYLTSESEVSAASMTFRLVTPAPERGKLRQDQLTDLVSEYVSRDISDLQNAVATLGERALRYGDMAVLVRKHSQAERVQAALRVRGIRSIVQSDQNVFASPEAHELQTFLEGVIDPRRDPLLKAALATSLLGFDAKRLFALDRDDQKRQAWLDRFSEWRQLWTNGCFTAMFRHLLVSQQVRARLVQLPAGERRLTNYLHLAELLHEAESTRGLTPDGICSWIREQRQSERVSEDRFQLRLESDEDAVQIVTIHKCKGLEYPVVFCPFLWVSAESSTHKELQFHDGDNPARPLTLDLRGKSGGADKHKEWQSEEVQAEELRLLYVAVTRAMNRCYIYVPDQKSEKSPLAQLFQSPEKGSLIDPVVEFAASSKGAVVARKDALSAAKRHAEAGPSREETLVTLEARPFTGSISRTAMSASFSGLNVAATESEEVDSDSDDVPIVEPAPDGSDLSIFTFDRGRRTGDFFHDVLEHLDFRDLSDLPEIVEQKLWAHGFALTQHRPAIGQVLSQLMEVELAPGMRLRDISKQERLSELEFSYPLQQLTSPNLAKVIGKLGLGADIRTRMGNLRFEPVEGFMRGFIDLLFRFKDRYYLLDWKSNWLGNRSADYGPEGMKRAMLEHNYYLQYHLYTVAVDLYLERRLPGYHYETHFGGVYYLFLRGIDGKDDPSNGVFRDRPAAKTIRSLRTSLIGKIDS